jgi:hypothetical protein
MSSFLDTRLQNTKDGINSAVIQYNTAHFAPKTSRHMYKDSDDITFSKRVKLNNRCIVTHGEPRI